MTAIRNEIKKYIKIWMTQEENNNSELKKSIKENIIDVFKPQKYTIYYLVSGNNDLMDSTHNIVNYIINK